MIEILLQKQNDEEMRIPLVNYISEVVLMLISKLREQKHHTGNAVDGIYIYIYTLLLTMLLVNARDLPIEQLHIILAGLITGILRNGSTQYMRGNLYAALLNYIQFTRRPTVQIASTEASAEKMVFVYVVPLTMYSLASKKRSHSRIYLKKAISPL